jgi:site-specific DNA-adenine methylase
MTYPGGKNGSGVYQQIINQIPPHEIYVEPFLGGGAILRMKKPAAKSICNDTRSPRLSPILKIPCAPSKTMVGTRCQRFAVNAISQRLPRQHPPFPAIPPGTTPRMKKNCNESYHKIE